MSELGFELPEPTKIGRRRGWLIVGVGVVLVSAAFLVGVLPRWSAHRALEAAVAQASQERAVSRVELISAKALTSDRDLILPGDVEPLEQTLIYGRTSGYLKHWLVDLGDQVKEGQLLAEIDSPEVLAQLEQAKAELAQAQADVVRAEANRGYSKVNVDRYRRLTPAGVSSQQDLERQVSQAEIDEANVAVARATVAAQEANVRRLVQLRSYARVTAPFGGTIIARLAERGALVNAGASPLFKLAALDTMRVMVQVPQDVAPSVRTGAPAKVSVREFAGGAFSGTVARAAGALDDASRTMNIEVWVQNPDRRLMAGMYAEVSLSLSTPHRLFEIPVTALFSDSRGTRVAVVDAEHKVSMRPITIERDTGQTLQISQGLDGSERIVKLASAPLSEGSVVQEIAPAKP